MASTAYTWRTHPLTALSAHPNAVLHIATFIAVFASFKLNQHLFFTLNTNPAVVLLPTGIGIAAVFLGGYRASLFFALAWFLVSLGNPIPVNIPLFLFLTLLYTAQVVIGAYALKMLGYQGPMVRIRCTLVLIAVALIVSGFAPTLSTVTQLLLGSLTVSPWQSWTRAWAGSVMSIMLFTPLITSWVAAFKGKDISLSELLETGMGFTALIISVYFIFWTSIAKDYSFLTLSVMFASLLWISARMRPFFISTALFMVAALGIVGVIVAHPNTQMPLSQQMLNIELFIVLIAPIFYFLTSVVAERRQSSEEARLHAQALEAANARLSQEDQTKNEFLAVLAHELRNPLAPIVTSLELLRLQARKHNDSEMLSHIDVADTHSRSISRLLDDLLDISRITRQKFKLQKEIVHLKTLIERSTHSVEGLYRARKHTLHTKLPIEDIRLYADPVRLEQIVVNILNNAAKYTEPGGTVTLEVVKNHGVTIKISDNGNGIPQEFLGKIFDPFIQAHDNPSKGLGIGLSLTKRLVELHGGTIWAESKGLGHGSTFTITLPREILTSQNEARAKDAAESLRKAFSVLVVDDNKPAAESLAQLLSLRGHRVVAKFSAKEALAYLKDAKVDAVLLDIGMPDMNGYEAARAIRGLPVATPVLIAVTGYGQEDDKLKSKEAGFDYHCTKPVRFEILEEYIAKGTSSKTPPHSLKK